MFGLDVKSVIVGAALFWVVTSFLLPMLARGKE